MSFFSLIVLLSPSSRADDGYRFGVDLGYQYGQGIDLGMYGGIANGAPSSISGQDQFSRGLLSFTYRPNPGIQLMAFGGVTLANSLYANAATSTSAGAISETLSFGSSPVYGMGAKIDLFPTSRFHLITGFRLLRTDLYATEVSIANSSGCSYDYENKYDECV